MPESRGWPRARRIPEPPATKTGLANSMATHKPVQLSPSERRSSRRYRGVNDWLPTVLHQSHTSQPRSPFLPLATAAKALSARERSEEALTYVALNASGRWPRARRLGLVGPYHAERRLNLRRRVAGTRRESKLPSGNASAPKIKQSSCSQRLQPEPVVPTRFVSELPQQSPMTGVRGPG